MSGPSRSLGITSALTNNPNVLTFSSSHLHHHHGLVIKRRLREPVDILENLGHHTRRALRAMPPHDLREAAPPILHACGTEMVGDAIGVKHQQIAGHSLK